VPGFRISDARIVTRIHGWQNTQVDDNETVYLSDRFHSFYSFLGHPPRPQNYRAPPRRPYGNADASKIRFLTASYAGRALRLEYATSQLDTYLISVAVW
jgi:hypothetical protein